MKEQGVEKEKEGEKNRKEDGRELPGIGVKGKGRKNGCCTCL